MPEMAREVPEMQTKVKAMESTRLFLSLGKTDRLKRMEYTSSSAAIYRRLPWTPKEKMYPSREPVAAASARDGWEAAVKATPKGASPFSM